MSYSESRDYGHNNLFIRLPLLLALGRLSTLAIFEALKVDRLRTLDPYWRNLLF